MGVCHPPPRKHDPSRTRRRTRRRTEPSPSSTYRFLLRLRRCGRPEATGGLRVAARSAIGGAAEAFESAWWRTTAAGQSLRCAPQLCAWRTLSPPPQPRPPPSHPSNAADPASHARPLRDPPPPLPRARHYYSTSWSQFPRERGPRSSNTKNKKST